MAVDVTFLPGTNTNNINTNFERVRSALIEALGREGDLPNHMNADLDMNSNDVLNADTVFSKRIILDGEDILDKGGAKGWSPVLAAVGYDNSIVMQLVDYVGGNGEKPKDYLGWYVGEKGYVQNISEASLFGGALIQDGNKGDITVSGAGAEWKLNEGLNTREFETRTAAEAWLGVEPMPDSIVIRGDAAISDGKPALFVKDLQSSDTMIINGALYGRVSKEPRPKYTKWVELSDTDGAIREGGRVIFQRTLDDIISRHPDRRYLSWNGDMVWAGDGTFTPDNPNIYDDVFDLKMWRNYLRQAVSDDCLFGLPGNHEVDRNYDGTNDQYANTYHSYKTTLGKINYAIRLGNTLGIYIGHHSRNGSGSVPDEIAEWCKKLVRDNQECSYIHIHTHQPLEGVGLWGSSWGYGYTQMGSDRFLSWLGTPGYRVDAWFSGHISADYSSPSVPGHVTFQGCCFIATDMSIATEFDKTYVTYDMVDGSKEITFKRWNVDKGELAKEWTISLLHPMETAEHLKFDGRYNFDWRYDVIESPVTIIIDPPRNDPSGDIPSSPTTALTVGVRDLENNNDRPGHGVAIDFLVPGANSGFTANDNEDHTHPYGYGARISAERRGNGERDFGSNIVLYSSISAVDPAFGDEYTEDQLRRSLELSPTTGWGYSGEIESFRWDIEGVKVGRSSNSGSGDPGVTINKSGTIVSFMSGLGNNIHQRFYNNSLISPSQVGYIQSSGSSTSYSTSSDETLKEDDGELSLEKAFAVMNAILVHEFRWKQSGQSDIGVFAQELHKVYPQAVTVGGWRDLVTGLPCERSAANAEYQPWGVDYSKLVSVLARCVQGTMARHDDIEARLTALES